MAQVPGMRLGKLKAQTSLPPTSMALERRRRAPINHKVTTYIEEAEVTLVAFSERDLALLQDFRREMRACSERACECTCHCHTGGDYCYQMEVGEIPTRFHFRKPNTSHKRTHRECPKEGRPHNR